MATKFVAVGKNTALAAGGAGGTAIADPLLREVVAGVEQPVAPHILIAVPKATAHPLAVTSVMAVGALAVDQPALGAGGSTFDYLAWRVHPVLRGDALNDKYIDVRNALPVAATNPNVDPLLRRAGTLVAPDIVIMMQKAIAAAVTAYCNVPTAMATGAIALANSAGAGDINQDILSISCHSMQRVVAAYFGNGQDRRRYFTIGNGVNAGRGAIYADRDDPTRLHQVLIAKVAADGSLLLTTTQVAGTTVATVGGADILDLVSGVGDAAVAYTGVRWEKYMDIQNAVAVANVGAGGLTFDPGLVENGTPVMPDIVIPIPKAAVAGGVAYVDTDLAGAVGTVHVAQASVGAVNHDILSIRIHSAFR